MAFDPNKFKAPEAKKLPVVLLLDISTSMSGEKNEHLYQSVCDMLATFRNVRQHEKLIDIAIITFGLNVEIHTPYTPANQLHRTSLRKFSPDGNTPMGCALSMAKAMIEDKDTTPSNVYRPVVVMVSDGMPNDDYEGPLHDFISTGRTSKCQRFAVAIGEDADKELLKSFCSVDENMFYADQATDIVEAFKTISMSVSSRATSTNPNQFADRQSASVTSQAMTSNSNKRPSIEDDDDVMF